MVCVDVCGFRFNSAVVVVVVVIIVVAAGVAKGVVG
jgi:hypothetical protein